MRDERERVEMSGGDRDEWKKSIREWLHREWRSRGGCGMRKEMC